MRILFVDDEPAILRAIRRILRHLPKEDSATLEADPLVAMQLLEHNAYDLVVTDMRMPRCSGFEILQQAARFHPEGVRVVLSGYSAADDSAEAMRHAHLFITKPFDSKVVLDLVERTRALLAMPVSEDLRWLLGGLKVLPPLPETFIQVSRALSTAVNAPSLREVARMLERDMAMSAKIIQMANSAFFSGAERVLRLEQAISLLGLHLVAGLVLQHELFAKRDFPAELASWRDRLNQHGLATASMALRLAREISLAPVCQDEASIAGLLHDVGRLVLLMNRRVPADAAKALAILHGVPLCEQEVDLFGAHHGWVGAYLLQLWGFPQSIVDAVAWHHQPLAAGHSAVSVLTLVHVADALVHIEAGSADEPDRAYLESLGCWEHWSEWQHLRVK